MTDNTTPDAAAIAAGLTAAQIKFVRAASSRRTKTYWTTIRHAKLRHGALKFKWGIWPALFETINEQKRWPQYRLTEAGKSVRAILEQDAAS